MHRIHRRRPHLQAVAVAVVTVRSILARIVGIRRFRIVVACHVVLATRNLKWIAYTVAVRIRQAVAVAVVTVCSILAMHRRIRRFRIVVARHVVLATRNLKWIAYTVAVRICKQLPSQS